MEKQVYQQIFDVEKNHWWFRGRRKIISATLKKYIPIKLSKALDVGSGTGLNSVILQEVVEQVSGLDPSDEAVRLSQLRVPNFKVLHSSFPETDVAENFSLITMFDVLEHISDDRKAIKKVESLLEHNGFAVITVPAFPFLWSDHDRVLHHYRRYTKQSLRELITSQTGLSVEYIEYFNNLLFLPIAFFRLLRKIFHIFPTQSDDFMVSPWINQLLLGVFTAEGKLMRKVHFPFGISIICVLKKNK